jgi:hypothetical protein
VIGSHNKPPPPSNDKVFIAEENGEPETPLDAPPLGKEKEPTDGIGIEGGELGDKGIELGMNAGELNGGTLVAVDIGIGDNPDISLENSTGSIPGGTGVPEAAAAAIIAAGVGSKVPVITL